MGGGGGVCVGGWVGGGGCVGVGGVGGAGEVRLGSVFTDVTPRKHARARICDQNETHFASVRAACTSKPEISTGVRFKVVPTFSELTIKACGSIIAGKACSSSFQVSLSLSLSLSKCNTLTN